MKQDLNKLSFEELQKAVEDLGKKKEDLTVKNVGVWQVGKNYVIRTVTMISVIVGIILCLFFKYILGWY